MYNIVNLGECSIIKKQIKGADLKKMTKIANYFLAAGLILSGLSF